jgi:hypothetical protein
MEYRIVIETQKDGKQWFYVQKRYLLYFWRYLREVRDISGYAYKIGWNTLEEAEQHIQNDVNWEYAQSQKKVAKREVAVRGK